VSNHPRPFAAGAAPGYLGRVSDLPPPGPTELTLTVASSALPSSDQRWRNQVDGLLADLRRNGGEIRRDVTPAPGQKGGAEAIILALGSSGAIAAAVTVFKAWLARAGDRMIEIQGKVGDRPVHLKLTGQNVDEQTLRLALGLARD